MSRRADVALGDIIRMARALTPGPAARAGVATVLGIRSWGEPAGVGETAGSEGVEASVVGPSARIVEPDEPGPPPASRPGAPPPLPPATSRRRRTELIDDPQPPGLPAPPRRIRPIAELVKGPGGWAPSPGDDVAATPLLPQDLFVARQQRAIVGALCASRRAEGDVDVDPLVESLCRGEAISELPRLPVLTTRAGLQLLIDVGAGMVPFRRDAERLVHAVRRVAGTDGVEVLSFDGSPLGDAGCGTGPIWRWKPYEPAGPGRPVLVVTDLGLGGRAPAPGQAAQEWLRFADLVRAHGGELTFLVPYPAGRWPVALCRRASIVSWDRGTDVRAVLHPARARHGMTAADRIQALAVHRPDVVRLARAVSLATRVEPELLRDARLRLSLDVSVEADLWWSDLVAAQNFEGIVLDPEVADELRAELARPDMAELRAWAWQRIRRRHAKAHVAVQLEELVNWLSTSSVPDAADRIEELLVAGAQAWMVSATDPVGGVRWMLSALRRLPRAARETPAASALGAAAATHAQVEVPDEAAGVPLPADALENWYPWLLARLPRTTVSVALGEGSVDFEAPGEHTHELSVPDAEPFVVRLTWQDGEPRHAEARVRRGQPLRIPVSADTVQLTTLAGTRHVLRRVGRPLADGGIDFSAIRVKHRASSGFESAAQGVVDAVRGFTGWVGVHGPSGAGKTTALCAALDILEAEPGTVVLQHFYRRGPSWQDEPEAVIASLVAQLRAAVPDLPAADEASPQLLRSGIDPPGDALHRLLGVLGDRGPDGPRVVVALDRVPGDSFDDVKEWMFRSPFPSLPAGPTCFVATSEYAQGIQDWLESGDPFRSVPIELSESQSACIAHGDAMYERLATAFGHPPNLGELVRLAEGEIATFRGLVDWLVSRPPGTASLVAVPAVFTPARHGLWASLESEIGPGALRFWLPRIAVAREGFLLRDLLWLSTGERLGELVRLLCWLRDRHLLADAAALAELTPKTDQVALVESFGSAPLALAHPAVTESLAASIGPEYAELAHRFLSDPTRIGGRGVPPSYVARSAMWHAVAGNDPGLVEAWGDASDVLETVHRFGPEAAAADLALARTVLDNRDLEALHQAVVAVRGLTGLDGLELARAVAHELAIRLGPEDASYHRAAHSLLRPLLELAAVEPVADGEGDEAAEVVAMAGRDGRRALLRRDLVTLIDDRGEEPWSLDLEGAVGSLVLMPRDGGVAVLMDGRLDVFDPHRQDYSLDEPPGSPELVWADAVGAGLVGSARDGRMVHWPDVTGEGRVLLGHRGLVTCATTGPDNLAARLAAASIVELVADGRVAGHGLLVGQGIVLVGGAAVADGPVHVRWQGRDVPATVWYRDRAGIVLLEVPVHAHPRARFAAVSPRYAELTGFTVSEERPDRTVVLTSTTYPSLGSQSARRRALESGIGRFVFERGGGVFGVVLEALAGGRVRVAPLSAADPGMLEHLAARSTPTASELVAGDQPWFLTGSQDGTAAVWTTKREAPVLRYARHRSAVTAVGVVGIHGFSGSEDGTLRIWSLDDGHDIAVHAPGGAVTSAIAIEGDRIAWGTGSGGVGVWDPSDAGGLRAYVGHDGRVAGLAEYEGRVLSWSDDGSVAFWEGSAREPAWSANRPPPVRAVDWSGGTELRVLWGDGRVQRLTMASRPSASACLAVSEMEGAVAVGVPDGLVVLPARREASGRVEIPVHGTPVACAFAGDNPIALTRDEDSAAEPLCMAAAGWTSAVGFASGEVVLREHDRSGAPAITRRFVGRESAALSLSYAPDGVRLVCGRADGSVEVWDAKDGTLRQVVSQRAPVPSVAIAGNVVAAADGSAVRRWALDSGDALEAREGHASRVTGLARASFDRIPDGIEEVFVSCDAGGEVKVWEPSTGARLEAFCVPAPLRALAADGPTIAALDARDRVWVWRLRQLSRRRDRGFEGELLKPLGEETELRFPFDVEVHALGQDGVSREQLLRVALDQPEGFWDETDEEGHLVARPLIAAGSTVGVRMADWREHGGSVLVALVRAGLPHLEQVTFRPPAPQASR